MADYTNEEAEDFVNGYEPLILDVTNEIHGYINRGEANLDFYHQLTTPYTEMNKIISSPLVKSNIKIEAQRLQQKLLFLITKMRNAYPDIDPLNIQNRRIELNRRVGGKISRKQRIKKSRKQRKSRKSRK
jgi:hypothetical protein